MSLPVAQSKGCGVGADHSNIGEQAAESSASIVGVVDEEVVIHHIPGHHLGVAVLAKHPDPLPTSKGASGVPLEVTLCYQGIAKGEGICILQGLVLVAHNTKHPVIGGPDVGKVVGHIHQGTIFDVCYQWLLADLPVKAGEPEGFFAVEVLITDVLTQPMPGGSADVHHCFYIVSHAHLLLFECLLGFYSSSYGMSSLVHTSFSFAVTASALVGEASPR